MGTNYRRIPKISDMVSKSQKLTLRLQEMNLYDASMTYNGFNFIKTDGLNSNSPWDEFTDGMSVHIGKRSGGWKFSWNFHNGKFYTNKKELFDFIRSGRIVNEYGEQIPTEEFIHMAIGWCVDGLDGIEEGYEKEVDGLSVSTSTDFS